jgi:uncharacterized membrane protein (GlpM family)
MLIRGFHLKSTTFPWTQFLIGGILFTLIKIISDNVPDIRIASIVAAFPIGLLASLIIVSNEREKYSFSYMISIGVLLLVAIIYYMLIKLTTLPNTISLGIAVICWIVINIVKTTYTTI